MSRSLKKSANAAKKGGFRLSMAWLHTWSGLWAGWVLFEIFLTGTLGVFDEAITRWMKPEKPLVSEVSTTAEQRGQAIRFAQAFVEKVAPKGHFWSIGLPNKDEPGIQVFWEDEQEKFQNARLDPATGTEIPKATERETEGGHHFVHMHYEFHAGMAGVWLVGFFTMAMLVALVSGIVIHKRIFKDFFTFQPRKGQRFWLDAHNAVAVLTFGPFDEGDGEKSLLRPSGGRMNFDGVTGEVLDVQMPRTTRGGDAQMVQGTLRTLHEAAFGGYAVKWLYFLCGMAGTAMMATGSMLFMVKRRQKSLHEFGNYTPLVYRLIDVLNVAVIAGLSVACIAFLWANRLISVEIEHRSQWELGAFFAVRGLMLAHAALRPIGKAWVEQLALAAALCTALPVVNGMTTGGQFVQYVAQGDSLRAGVEWTTIALGGLLAYAAWRIHQKVNKPKPVPAKKAVNFEEKQTQNSISSAQEAMKPGVL